MPRMAVGNGDGGVGTRHCPVGGDVCIVCSKAPPSQSALSDSDESTDAPPMLEVPPPGQGRAVRSPWEQAPGLNMFNTPSTLVQGSDRELTVPELINRLRDPISADNKFGSRLLPQPHTLVREEMLGAGGFGKVYHGIWLGTVDVAIKYFHDVSQESDDFMAELEIMMDLSHPQIVQFYGAVIGKDERAIVMQYVPRGSLHHLLHKERVEIAPRQRLLMARQIAAAMAYLHARSPSIIHGDLKSLNLLVDQDWSIKVCDFGLSRMQEKTFLTAQHATPAWTAPEVLRGEKSNEKIDVYSYGVVLWELVTRQRPWSHIDARAIHYHITQLKARPELPPDLQPEVSKLISDCWAETPTKRPTFKAVFERLKGLNGIYESSCTASKDSAVSE